MTWKIVLVSVILSSVGMPDELRRRWRKQLHREFRSAHPTVLQHMSNTSPRFTRTWTTTRFTGENDRDKLRVKIGVRLVTAKDSISARVKLATEIEESTFRATDYGMGSHLTMHFTTNCIPASWLPDAS